VAGCLAALIVTLIFNKVPRIFRRKPTPPTGE
jgi:hypothetical protein